MTRTLVLLLVLPALVRAEPSFEKINLFEAEKGAYAFYRIPGIVVTPKGSLLAYCEARKHRTSDWGHIDILLRRSSDGGKTWEAPRNPVLLEGKFERNPAAVKKKLGKEGELTINNPVAVADHKTGQIHFLFCVEYGRCFVMRSDDDGKTFTKPKEITQTFEKFRKDYAWRVLATGPGRGIQLRGGRLIVPVWLSTGTGGHAHRPSCVSVIFSDDHGQTWQRGDIVIADPELANPSETAAVELEEGSVMLNIRHESAPHFRAVSISADGATGWSKVRLDKALPEPICMGSIVRFSRKTSGDKSRILFANPDNPKNRDRKNVTVRLSYDEGKTWPVARSLEPGPSGYSDLAVGRDGTIYCFFERGPRVESLCLARFNLDWLIVP
jgi:sialidase-1